jgi:hypothetical protein
MKKLFATFGLVVGILLAGCTTLNNLTPAQVAQIGTVITQVADEGAVYAIQQSPANKAYFVASIPVLDNFANGTDLSPTALQGALAGTSLATNQWVGLAITAVVTAYDVSYSQYISGQLTNAPYAKAWIVAVETGFKEATGVAASKTVAGTPAWVVKGKVDKAVITARVKAARK